MTTQTAIRALSLAGRLVPSAFATAAVVGLGIYAWRAWLRLREEGRWQVAWAEYQRAQRLPRD